MPIIENPILRGFNPDPSILRVGDDYYIATSTFEWFPGVRIHHSRDLANWRLIGHALTRKSQLDLTGVPDSGGIWAPSLSYDAGKFYLIYTIMRTFGMGKPFKDMHNYLVTADRIDGAWTEPIFLNSSGFDPSLFHDTDGRKWLVNIEWDYRQKNGHHRFQGILLQEYSETEQRLIGEARNILKKDTLIEGPNLYKKDGFYYLMLAEGGTGWEHSISMARSKSIAGPYELDPQEKVLTARDDETVELQKAGHGELVETPTGEWYLAHLAGRPVGESRRCILGRETCLQKVTWNEEGWLRLESGGIHPLTHVPAPDSLSAKVWEEEPPRDDFDKETLSLHWDSLRVPVNESWLTLKERQGFLRLRGRETLHSLFEQSLIAKRLPSFVCTAETGLEFAPAHYNQSAGLICWYNTRIYYYLRVSHDENLGKVLGITLTDNGVYEELSESRIVINDWERIRLRAEINRENLQFFAASDAANWQPIGTSLDMTKISDDYGNNLHFTGAFVGICAQDLNGTRLNADFDYFEMTADPLKKLED